MSAAVIASAGVTAAAVQSERAAGGRRQADAVGELLERGDALWFALARLPLAEPSLGDAGQLGYLPLGDRPREPSAEMTAPRSRLAQASSTSGRAQTRSTIARTSAGLTAIGAPVSLGRSPVVWSVCASIITLRSDTGGRWHRFARLRQSRRWPDATTEDGPAARVRSRSANRFGRDGRRTFRGRGAR